MGASKIMESTDNRQKLTDERKAFEEHMADPSLLLRNADGDYMYMRVARLWRCWQARAALSAPAVPEGWKLVPIEPTPEIIEAMRNGPADYHFRDIYDQINAAYCRAIAAAPQPQEPQT